MSALDLMEIYSLVKEKIDSVVFEELWPCFKRYDFALYNASQVILNGQIFQRQRNFLPIPLFVIREG